MFCSCLVHCLPFLCISVKYTAYLFCVSVSSTLPTFFGHWCQVHCLPFCVSVSSALPTFFGYRCQVHCLHFCVMCQARCLLYTFDAALMVQILSEFQEIFQRPGLLRCIDIVANSNAAFLPGKLFGFRKEKGRR